MYDEKFQVAYFQNETQTKRLNLSIFFKMNESEFRSPTYFLDATTRNSALTRRRDTYFRYVWRKTWPKYRSDG